MAYWLIAAALILVIAPVFWLAPTSRERRLARIRPVAFRYGVRVKPAVAQHDSELATLLAQYPALQKTVWTRYQLAGKVAQASAVPSDDQEPQAIAPLQGSWYLLPDDAAGWRWQPARATRTLPPPPLRASMAVWENQQGGRLLAVHLRPGEVAVDWDEHGSEQDVGVLCAEMTSWLT